MKLKELSESIASACNVRSNVVAQVQAETFRQLRTALEKGEKVQIPDFGIFVMKDVPGEGGEPGRKVVRFKGKSGDKKAGKKEKKKEGRGEKKAEAASAGSAAADDEGDED
ncbi:MAG TPA: HU family DNA-binding protein [Rhizomicrobium sp.]|jgi:nucleoid DNA-binding protein|nr:HU family DNA-binding protein [Rhizomicrobium sp.]